MKYDFDILFLDTSSKKYYDLHTLENKPLGGTEASCVRIAEGLAGFGLKVAVVESLMPYFEPMTSKHAFYFHVDDLPKITCKHFIQMRGVLNSHLFPKAKKYLWLHDEADERIKDWNPVIDKYRIKIIGVSRWHQKDIQKYVLSSQVYKIYNPVPDEIYSNQPIYNKNNFVWAASSHKGLKEALLVFEKIKQKLPKANLIICHPGYHSIESAEMQVLPGISVYGAIPCKTLWNIFQQSLCVFYPSQYNETFCCLLAEANALGVPFLGYNRQVLKEVVSSDDQLVEDGNKDAIVNQAVNWSEKRPIVNGKEDFKLSKVIFKWLRLFGES